MILAYPNLAKAMEEKRVSIRNLADLIETDEETICLKIKGTLEWSLSEAITICRYLEHPDINLLFLRFHYKHLFS